MSEEADAGDYRGHEFGDAVFIRRSAVSSRETPATA
jgi:hypothetical protein